MLQIMPKLVTASFLLFLALLGASGILQLVFYRLWLFVKPNRMMTCVPRQGSSLLILLIDLNFVLSVFGIAPPASLLLLLRPLSCDLLGPLIFLHLPMLLLLIWLTIVLVLLLSFRAGVLLPALPLLALLLPALLLPARPLLTLLIVCISPRRFCSLG